MSYLVRAREFVQSRVGSGLTNLHFSAHFSYFGRGEDCAYLLGRGHCWCHLDVPAGTRR